MTDRKAALEALERIIQAHWLDRPSAPPEDIALIRAALSEPAAEPVAWGYKDEDGKLHIEQTLSSGATRSMPLHARINFYAAPQPPAQPAAEPVAVLAALELASISREADRIANEVIETCKLPAMCHGTLLGALGEAYELGVRAAPPAQEGARKGWSSMVNEQRVLLHAALAVMEQWDEGLDEADGLEHELASRDWNDCLVALRKWREQCPRPDVPGWEPLWRWVPVEPTREMRKAGRGQWLTSDPDAVARAIYQAMLAAAPKPEEKP